jgi:predicted Zn-dependent peptidase
MSDMVARPRFEPEALESEREVVLEEIAMIEDDPSDLVHDLAARCVFGDHELGRPVIGTTATVRALTTGDIAAYHANRYGAANVVIAAAGNVEHEAFRALVADSLQLGAAQRADRSTPEVIGGRQLFLARDTEQYHVCLSAPGLPRDDERRFALALLDHVLGGAASSRLVQEVREQRGMAYSVYSYVASYDDAGQLGIYFGTRAENVRECVEIARAQMADFAAGGLTADELERAKESVKGRMLLALESTSSRMSRLGRAVLSGSEILSLDDVAARIDAVTHDDITTLAAELLAPEAFSTAGIGPDHDRFRAAVGGEVVLLEGVA